MAALRLVYKWRDVSRQTPIGRRSFPRAVLVKPSPSPAFDTTSASICILIAAAMVKIATLAALVSGAGYAMAGAVQQHPDILPSRRDVLKAREEGLRLIKTSDEDPGVWVTEDEKFEQFVAKKIGFVDITDTLVGGCQGSMLPR